MAEQGFTLSSPDFEHEGQIPEKFTGEGSDVPPRLKWMHAPSGTQSYALIMEDPDAPGGTFTHWVCYNLPPNIDELPSGGVGAEAKNDFQKDGYGGPYPPPNHGEHRYFFRLYALDVDHLDVELGSKREAVEAAMAGHALGQAELMGRYERTSG